MRSPQDNKPDVERIAVVLAASAMESPTNQSDNSGNDVHTETDSGDVAMTAKTIRRMDWIILPIMTTLLGLCFIDRSNIGLAVVAGMGEELEFRGNQYSIALLVFFPGYALFVIPSNYFLRKTSVRYWLTILSFSFGVFTLGTGLIRNYAGLVGMRVMLGIFEAGVYPTIIVVVSSWYPRYYFGKRMTIIATGASLIAALAGVLAYAFSRIKVPGYMGWHWIFILEGAITMIVALGGFFILDEYLQTSKLLSQEQRHVAVGLIERDREEHEQQELAVQLILQVLCDWQVWVFAFLYMLSVTTTYAMSYFVPLILNRQMGFSGALSQLLSTPPYFYAFLVACGVSWYSDRIKLRAPIVIFLSLNVIMGVLLVRWGPNTGSQYLGIFFTISGSLVNGPMIIVFGQNNAPTRAKRSVSSGLQLTLGAVGGIFGSLVFRSQDAPTYTPGVIAVICCTITIICLSTGISLHFRRQNRLSTETGLVLEGQQGFLYTL